MSVRNLLQVLFLDIFSSLDKQLLLTEQTATLLTLTQHMCQGISLLSEFVQ